VSSPQKEATMQIHVNSRQNRVDAGYPLRLRRAFWLGGLAGITAAAAVGMAQPSYGASSESPVFAKTSAQGVTAHRARQVSADPLAGLIHEPPALPAAVSAAKQDPAHRMVSEHAPHGGTAAVQVAQRQTSATKHRSPGVRSTAPHAAPAVPKHRRDTISRSSELFWLARVIEAEAGGEPMCAKIAVGDVVMNRVHSADYPNTVKGVLFQVDHGHYEFTCVMNGRIYRVTPSSDSIRAAEDVLDKHINLVPAALVFYNPAETSAHNWVRARPVITTYGKLTFAR
jgi:spore germination cell wall hydrolase CwlJ-like protein